jgi:hypothetical protein
MAAVFSVKHAGVWKAPTEIRVKHASVWKIPTNAYVRNAGVWQQYWPAAPVAPTTKYVTDFTPGIAKNNFTGELGYAFQPINTFTATWVGFKIVSGNTGTHTVKIYDYGTNTLLRTVTFDLSALTVTDTFVWMQMSSLTFTGMTSYMILKVVTSGGQQWWDQGATTLSDSINTFTVSRTGTTNTAGNPNTQFVGLDLGW